MQVDENKNKNLCQNVKFLILTHEIIINIFAFLFLFTCILDIRKNAPIHVMFYTTFGEMV